MEGTNSQPAARSTTSARLRSAILLAVGSELVAGETRDTNGGDLAAALTQLGVRVVRMAALPDDLSAVVAQLRGALSDANLVVATGGLGPTPDDLTREAIAAVWGEEPVVDPSLEEWLRNLFERRGIAFLPINLKQAWLIPSAKALPNSRGTAPGWWVERPDGRLVVAMPGPPSEMQAMWRDEVLPRLQARGLGERRVVRTYRLTGIGESAVADLLGEELLRAANPVVATYARADALDVRVSAVEEDGRDPDQIADEASAKVLALVGDYVWGHGDDTWLGALGEELDRLGWKLAVEEIGTSAATLKLLGEGPWLSYGLCRASWSELRPLADSSARAGAAEATWTEATRTEAAQAGAAAAEAAATRLRASSGCEVALVVVATERGGDMAVQAAVATSSGSWSVDQVVFLGGSEGRRRAALAGAALLLRVLRQTRP